MNNSKFKIQNSKLAQAPWHLAGSAALLLSARGAVALVHYEASPVGPYDEWARCVLTARGPRVVEMLVTSPDSMRAGRENWGFPKRLAQLKWKKHAGRVSFEAPAAIYRLRACGPRFPLRVKFFCVQTLGGQDVRVPFELGGKARLAWRGRQMALLIEEFVFKEKEAEEVRSQKISGPSSF